MKSTGNDEPPESCPGPASDDSIATSPGQTRLSIRHLMVWGLCVAVYCSASQSVQQTGNAIVPNPPVLSAANEALTSGTALAGLLLLLARRRRRAAYPRFGGEWLWSLAGIHVALTFVASLFYLMAATRPLVVRSRLLTAVSLGYLGVLAIAYLIAIWRCEGRRWKVVIVLIPATTIAATVLLIVVVRISSFAAMERWMVMPTVVKTSVLCSAIAVAALIDFRQARRYPWSHWVGILLEFWQAATSLAAYIVYTVILQHRSFLGPGN